MGQPAQDQKWRSGRQESPGPRRLGLGRPVEAGLLGIASATTLALWWALVAARGAPAFAPAFVPPLSLVGAAWLVHLALLRRRRGTDQILLPAVLVLMGLSLSFVTRLAPDSGGGTAGATAGFATRQWWWLLAGTFTLGLAVCGRFPLRWLQRYRYTWALAGILLVALTLVGGRSAGEGGPRLWLGSGLVAFQPSELMKLLLVVFLAGYLEDRQELITSGAMRIGRLRLPPFPYLAPLGAILGLSLALLAIQRDLGAALLLYAIALGMLYLASGRLDYVLGGLALFVVGAAALFRYLGIVQDRVAIWLDPWSLSGDLGYQLVQALLAQGAGGILGTGIGNGAPTLIPAVHTDFVYAAIAEELGLAGASAILLIYALLVIRGFRIAIRSNLPFDRLLAAGLSFALAVQTFIIVGGVVKLIPLTGITLPFLSYGGSSMLTSAVSVGLLLRISEPPRARRPVE